MKKPGIREFIAAGTPLLFVRTCEVDTAEKEVKKEAGKVKAESIFGTWKSTTGLQLGNMADDSISREVSGDCLRAFRHIQDSRNSIIAVFHNMRFFVNNPQVIQQIVDTAEAAKKQGSHLIFVGPVLPLPEELAHLVMFIDLPLPTRQQIEKNFKLMVGAYKAVIKLPKTAQRAQKLIRDAANSAIGLPMTTAENAIALSIATSGKIDIEIIQSQKEQEIKKSDCLEFVTTPELMSNVGGFREFKNWMQRRSKVFTDEARKYGLSYPKGVLIVGQPGTGKSLAAKATASYLKLPLIRLDIGRVFDSLVGASESRMRLALKTVEAVAPVVLWVDELDKSLAGSSSSGSTDSGVTARVVSTLLTWRQETKYPIMMLCTANEIENIPSTVYRKGRMDEIWATDLPTEDERVEIFRIHIVKRDRDPEKFSLETLAKATENFVGSEIESCLEDGMFYAFDEGVEVATRHIMTAIKDTIPQAKRDSKDIEKIRSWVATNARYVGEKMIQETQETKSRISVLAKD